MGNSSPMALAEQPKVALITGITGQDGSYLAELLLEKGYMVHGIIRRSSSFNTGRIEHLFKETGYKLSRTESGESRLFLHYGDLADTSNLVDVLRRAKPDEIYNLAAQSHVQVSFEMPEYTADVTGVGVLRLLDAIRSAGLATSIKFYREAYNMHACNGILFNHEGPRRGLTFVTRKITRCVALIQAGQQEVLSLGNIDAKRDWGHAKDYVEGMWRMLQAPVADDFVLATGETHTVREFVELAFKEAGFTITWHGEKGTVDEVGKDQEGKVRVKIDPQYFRPTEVDLLLGDPAKAEKALGWKRKVSFQELVEEMVRKDIEFVG